MPRGHYKRKRHALRGAGADVPSTQGQSKRPTHGPFWLGYQESYQEAMKIDGPFDTVAEAEMAAEKISHEDRDYQVLGTTGTIEVKRHARFLAK